MANTNTYTSNYTSLPNGATFTKTTHNDTYPFIKPTQFDLSNKAIFITGASKGIGLATAHSYAAAGASTLILGARSPMPDVAAALAETAKKAGRAQGPKVLSLKLDVLDEDSVEAAAKQIESEVGRLDILVNNAGYLEEWVPLGQADTKNWWRTWEVNVKGVFLVTRACLGVLERTVREKQGSGTILMASSYGAHGRHPGASAYQTTKLAVARLSEFINVDHGANRILCFSAHPGSVSTELARGMPEHMHELLKDSPEMCGDALVWLTAERREWLAGRFVSVAWDMEEFLGMRERIEREDLLKVQLQV